MLIKLRSLHGRREAGDTIVEVLIATAVVSLVLVGAYASVNHNTLGIQDTQEHTQALKLAQSQVEFLNEAASAATPSYPPANGCFSQSGVATTGGACIVSAAGTGSCATEPCFHITIQPSTATLPYIVRVQWASIQNGTTSTVQLYFRPVVAGP